MHAYCWASGQIEFGRKVPEGAIRFASGTAAVLRTAIEPAARLSYDNETLLVPGIPEADDQSAAGDALARWLALQLRISFDVSASCDCLMGASPD